MVSARRRVSCPRVVQPRRFGPAPRLRPPLAQVRLRAAAPADATPVRPRNRPAAGRGRGAGTRADAGLGRGADRCSSARVRGAGQGLIRGPIAGGRDGRGPGGQPGLHRYARGVGVRGGWLAGGNGRDPRRPRRACLPPRRRAPSRDGIAGLGVLRLQRRGPGRDSGSGRGAARPLRRSRRAPRRRRAGRVPARPRRPDAVHPRERARPVPRDGLHPRAGGRSRRRDLGQPAAGAVHGGGGLAVRGTGARANARRGLRAGRGREPARCGLARMGPAGAPAGDDDGDGGRGPDRRCRGPPLGRRPVAGDGRRRLRRLPGGAADVGADLAGRGAP